jgi:ATPase subunit of ABC transporter with duplicated ATPase domains
MIEINVSKVTKNFGFKNILNELSFEVKTGEVVSIIGENGCGKTTILNIISGIEKADSGLVTTRKDSKIGYLNQMTESLYHMEIVKDILYEGAPVILELSKSLSKYEEKMMIDNNMATINKYLKIQDRFISMGGYELNTKIEKISHGLNIDHLINKHFNELSGGEQRRVVLAKIIISSPSILLLDEPTNHLDIKSLEWLEDFLKKYNGTILLVSHDRYFLDKVSTKTILIEHSKAVIFHGNYSYYLKENEDRIEREFKKYKDQQKLIASMKKKIRQLEEFGKLAYPGGEPFFRRAENIRKRLARLELVDRPIEKKDLPLDLAFDKRSGKDALVIKDYDLMIDDILLISNINFKINYGERICLIGDNGSGKTTLIKHIMSNSEDNIKLGTNIKIGYIPQQITFERDMTVLEYARKFYIGEESHLRSALNKFYFHGEQVFKKVNNLSGGEKVRLKLFELIQSNTNFIILDEPTNHIDIDTKETLEDALLDYKGTLLFVSHDRYFINKLADKILYIDNKQITEYVGNYDYFNIKIKRSNNS